MVSLRRQNIPQVIPRLRRVTYAAYADFPIDNRRGDLGFATDRLVLYRWSGAAWQPITFSFSSGATGAKPTAADLPNGSMYYDTTLNRLEQVQAGSWVVISGGVDAGIVVEFDGAIANIPSGYVICDGNSGTVNRLTRFPKQVDTAVTEPGTTGGSSTHGHGLSSVSNSDTGGSGAGKYGFNAAGPSASSGGSPPLYIDTLYIMKT